MTEHKPTCWCGGERGPREPADADGWGCLVSIYHANSDTPTTLWTAAYWREYEGYGEPLGIFSSEANARGAVEAVQARLHDWRDSSPTWEWEGPTDAGEWSYIARDPESLMAESYDVWPLVLDQASDGLPGRERIRYVPKAPEPAQEPTDG